MSRLSLRARLLLLTAGLLPAGLGLVGVVVSDQLERYQLGRVDAQLRSFGEIISRASATAPPDDVGLARDPELLAPALDLVGTPYLVYLAADGSVARDLHSSRLDGATLPTPDQLRAVPIGGEAVDLRAADGSGRWRAVWPGRPPGGPPRWSPPRRWPRSTPPSRGCARPA